MQNERGEVTDIDLVRAEGAEVVAAVRVRLELEQRLVVGVVGGVLPQGSAGGRRLRLRRQHGLGVRHLLDLLQQLRFGLDSAKIS